MRLKIGKMVFSSTAAMMVLGLASAPAFSAEKAPTKIGWAFQMRELEKTLNDLLIDVTSEERFNDRKNFAAIDKNAAKLARLAKDLNDKVAVPDPDPSLRLIGGDFARETKYAADALKGGHRAYARVMLNTVTGYCIACHTRSSAGPQFGGAKVDSRLDAMKPLEKANYLAATRNFDQAFLEYEKVLESRDGGSEFPFAYEKAIRGGLGIAVRVKRDPALALKLVDHVLDGTKVKAPFYLRERAMAWKKSILAWKSESKKGNRSPDALYDEAIRLIADAKANQKFPVDRSADVLYLRASGVVHDLLATGPKGTLAAKANYLAGLCYEVLDDYGIRDFNEYYYMACIRADPHTEIARGCYQRYEESVYFGYTGSGGTYLPADVRARLNEFDLLSVPAGNPKGSGGGNLQ